MHVVADSWWQPKRGHAPEEYEDAFCPVHADLATAQFRCAVADGATEASFSRQWARTLTRAFWHGALRAEHFAADIERLQARWRAVFAARRQAQLPWYAQQKAEFGAFAAIVGFSLHEHPADQATGAAPAPTWEALAIGDSNLFQVRADRMHVAFPLTRAEEFGRSPFLVPTRGHAGNDLVRHLRLASGDWQPDDTFYLMTDALACWFLRSQEGGEHPWQTLDAMTAGPDAAATFANLVASLREQQLLHNDDVTLVRIRAEAQAPLPPEAGLAPTTEEAPLVPTPVGDAPLPAADDDRTNEEPQESPEHDA
jgi:hypothetical protein